MIFNGYDITEDHNYIHIVECDTTALAAMLQFSKRFPLGSEPEWDAFIVKNTNMQDRERNNALIAYARMQWGTCKLGKTE